MKYLLAFTYCCLLCVDSTAQLRIELSHNSRLLLPQGPVYLATDFDHWNPANPAHKFKKDSTGTYYLQLDSIPLIFYYKITQGNWTLVEGSATNAARPNRIYERVADNDLIRLDIEGWERKMAYTFIVRSIPASTPFDASLYITGNFNNWNPRDPLCKLNHWEDGTWHVILYTDKDNIEYKFTRGTQQSTEAYSGGRWRSNRKIIREAGVKSTDILVDIEGWEDFAGQFHIAQLPDLFILFSAFLGLLLVLAIPVIYQYFRQANRWLMAYLGMIAATLALHVVSHYQVALVQAKIRLLSDFALFIYCPVFLFYLNALSGSRRITLQRIAYALLPVMLLCIVYLPYLLMDTAVFEEKIVNQDFDITFVFYSVQLLALGWNIYYWRLNRHGVRLYLIQRKTHYSDMQSIALLASLLTIQATSLWLWGILIALSAIQNLYPAQVVPMVILLTDSAWLVLACIPYVVGYFAIRRPQIFKKAQQSVPAEKPETTVPETYVIENTADEQMLNGLKEKVDKYIRKHKSYTNPELSLHDLAGSTKIPARTLSEVINKKFGMSFFDFINSYRIEEFKRLVDDPQFKHYRLLALAHEAGFNSKSAFNRSFKKITSQTPSEYFQARSSAVDAP